MQLKPRLRVMTVNRIDTERLILRPPVEADCPAIAEMIGDWDVARWLVRIPYPYGIDQARYWVERSNEERALGLGWPFMLITRGGGGLIGAIDLTLEQDRGSAALGYWIGAGHWGCGFGSEAAEAMVGFAFSILGLSRVTASALPDNSRSIAVLKKAGLRGLGRRTEEETDRGMIEVEHFAIERSQWAAPL